MGRRLPAAAASSEFVGKDAGCILDAKELCGRALVEVKGVDCLPLIEVRVVLKSRSQRAHMLETVSVGVVDCARVKDVFGGVRPSSPVAGKGLTKKEYIIVMVR